jgi:hypothetical protein
MLGNLYDFDLQSARKLPQLSFSLPESKQSVPFVNHESAQLFKISDAQLPHSKQLMQTVGFIPALHDQQALHFGDHVLNHFLIT